MAKVSLPKISTTGPGNDPTDIEKTTIYLGLVAAGGDPAKLINLRTQVVEPIFTRLGRKVPKHLGSLNRYSIAIQKAVEANDAAVIKLLTAAGIAVTP